MSSREGQGTMTGREVQEIRMALGLSDAGLAGVLQLGRGGDRTVRRWESGEQRHLAGPVQVLLALLRDCAEARKLVGIRHWRGVKQRPWPQVARPKIPAKRWANYYDSPRARQRLQQLTTGGKR